ncbi:MAG TPA: hypothetical protein VF006_06735 [Longimicrobium sp.]
MAELILIFSTDAGGDPRGRYRVTQRFSPRVVIVEAGDMTKEALRSENGVLAVLGPGDDVADDVRRTLTPTEALAVDACTERSRRKERPGDGLSWEAGGFVPPDPPPS